MRFDLHLREQFHQQLASVADKMKEWEDTPRLDELDQEKIRESIQSFKHTTHVDRLRVAGVDGSGDYPCVSYSDSFVHVTVAHGTIYEANQQTGLKEIPPQTDPIIQVTWMAEESDKRREAWDGAFSDLALRPFKDVVEESDYRILKASASGRNTSVAQLTEQLLRPHAHDSGNIGIQLRSMGELGAALNLIETHSEVDLVLVDGTLSLPLVTRRDASLFYEHLKRMCCVTATKQRVGFFALSKSHGLPSIELIEQLAQERISPEDGKRAEHWYLRLPIPDHDDWEFGVAEGRNLPPIGAVTYLVRFHRRVPVLRLDMDRNYWERHVKGDSKESTQAVEKSIFEKLDYSCHDQRCFGYPYPIKAGHDRASLTSSERASLRKLIVDAAVARGLRRSLFRDVSFATGHK